MPTPVPAPVPVHVSLIAIPDAVISTLGGIYDVLGQVAAIARDEGIAPAASFRVEILGTGAGPVGLASGLPLPVHRPAAEVAATDIAIVPSVLLGPQGWRHGRYPGLVDWLREMHRGGAVLCSACSGIFLLAETGLFDGVDATVHWSYVDALRAGFPAVSVLPERALVVAGGGRLVSSGAATSWHDLVLHLIAERAGIAVAQAVARFFALEWHREGLAPFITFRAPRGHGDMAVLAAQDWLERHASVARPVEEMVARSGLAERTFKRRFTQATGLAPIAYVQRLRVEAAKRRLETTGEPVDAIAWRVGYEDPAFFRRLFRRLTGLPPGDYRRKFRLPGMPG